MCLANRGTAARLDPARPGSTLIVSEASEVVHAGLDGISDDEVVSEFLCVCVYVIMAPKLLTGQICVSQGRRDCRELRYRGGYGIMQQDGWRVGEEILHASADKLTTQFGAPGPASACRLFPYHLFDIIHIRTPPTQQPWYPQPPRDLIWCQHPHQYTPRLLTNPCCLSDVDFLAPNDERHALGRSAAASATLPTDMRRRADLQVVIFAVLLRFSESVFQAI